MSDLQRTVFAMLGLALAGFVYFYNLGSEHAATNPDELLYIQITRLTAEKGAWLPLQSISTKSRNTKPPALFWQGMASTGWGRHWDLWHLRWPNTLYSLATAAMAFLLARKLGGRAWHGAIAAMVYLASFGVYRHDRVFLTEAPETFWLFAPFFVLLMWRPRAGALTWPLSIAFGLMVGVGLLYKSFALVIPFAAGLAWWTLHLRGYRLPAWLRGDAPKIALTCALALGVFSLWYWLDPQRELILQDFILKENFGKFDSGDESYLLNLVWGKHSIWAFALGWLVNAGLVAPAVLAVFVIAFLRRREMSEGEKLLWIWAGALFLSFIPSNLRYERYLLPALPGVAVICALHWTQIPRWMLGLTLAACAVIAAGMGAGAVLLTRELGAGPLYAWSYWALVAGTVAFAATGILRSAWTHEFALPAVFLLYLVYACFLRPFDGPLGEYSPQAIEAMRGRTVVLPTPHGGRDEIYRFMLPGCDVRQLKTGKKPGAAELAKEHAAFIVPLSIGDTSVERTPGVRVVGKRLSLEEYFDDKQMMDMLRGNVARHLFQQDVLVEVLPRPAG